MADIHVLRHTNGGRHFVVKVVTEEISHQVDKRLLSLIVAGAQTQGLTVYCDTYQRYLAGSVDQMR